MARNVSQCDQCGQVDDHPKAHFLAPENADTYHYDCIPHGLRQQLDGPVTARVEAAVSGTHGDKLVTFIEKQEDI